MKVSTKGRYALRLLTDLAIHSTGEPVKLKDIAMRQGISDKYSEQIISVLNKGGVVKSIRGAQGGYILKKTPSDYTVGMILRLTEGSLAPVSCVDDDELACDKAGGCATVKLWMMMNEAVKSVVDKVTLQDLIDWQKESQCNSTGECKA